jgi:predicted HicB family RNase H-like nuclease
MSDPGLYAITVRKVLVDGEEMWRATVRELPDLAEFAATRDEAVTLAHDAIQDLQAAAAEDGRVFPEPFEDEEEYSGRVTLRMSKSMHRAAALHAVDEGVSLNSYIVECIARNPGAGVTAQTAEIPFVSLDTGKWADYVKQAFESKMNISTTTVMSSTIDAMANSGVQYALGTATHTGRSLSAVPAPLLRDIRRSA